MSSKLKKVIIAVVVLLLVGVGVLVGVSMLSRLSTTTIYDLRLVDYETETEIFEKEVYLTAIDNNNFDIKVEASSSSITSYVVSSSNPSVATVSMIDGGYRVNYLKEGQARISVVCAEGGNISDSFNLTVKENVPTSFIISDSSAISDSEITIFADDRYYYFNFTAGLGNDGTLVNITSIEVLDNYNKEVFDEIYIDDKESMLVIKAKQSELNTREYITLQSKYTSADGNQVTVGTFIVCVNVRGNYISDIQLVLSETPNFDNANDIYGNGAILNTETRVNAVYLTSEVNTLYAKVRVVYTNGEIFDVTSDAVAQTINGAPTTTKPPIGDYYAISLSARAVIRFAYLNRSVDLQFNYIDPVSTPVDYNRFVNQLLYETVDIEGTTVYRYIYWDSRYMRDDAITDKDGNIVGFINGNPETGN